VTITGSNLRGAGSQVASVTLNGVEVAEISSQNNTHVVVVAAAGSGRRRPPRWR
jgi:predicted lipid-binding transport protein (Tim44 family)